MVGIKQSAAVLRRQVHGQLWGPLSKVLIQHLLTNVTGSQLKDYYPKEVNALIRECIFIICIYLLFDRPGSRGKARFDGAPPTLCVCSSEPENSILFPLFIVMHFPPLLFILSIFQREINSVFIRSISFQSGQRSESPASFSCCCRRRRHLKLCCCFFCARLPFDAESLP